MKKSGCAKCRSALQDGSVRVEGGIAYQFCKFCTCLLNEKPTGNIVHAFLNDYIDLTDVERSMLEARMRRANGKSVWADQRKDGDNKGQGCG